MNKKYDHIKHGYHIRFETYKSALRSSTVPPLISDFQEKHWFWKFNDQVIISTILITIQEPDSVFGIICVIEYEPITFFNI